MRNIFCIALFLMPVLNGRSQKLYLNETLIRHNYDSAFTAIQLLLRQEPCFQKAVFITENCFRNYRLDNKKWLNAIAEYRKMCHQYMKNITVKQYSFDDQSDFIKNYSIYKIIGDTTELINDSTKGFHLPFVYDLSDPLGELSWANMFVTKLISTNTGNCHSLSYLYKILADELQTKCWLSLAPSHMYIRNYSDKIGWYNTELTSGTFPTDAWIMATGYISPSSISNGLFMDTLSNIQSVALCLLDLAKGYEYQTGNYYDGFILQCCDAVLQYHQTNPMALLLKAETLRRIYIKQNTEKNEEARITYNKMSNYYIQLAKLGYREMPPKMYKEWLKGIRKQH